jgi:hypothetical protein
MPYSRCKTNIGRQKSKMERMVANYTRDYGRTNLKQFGDRSCRRGGPFEKTGCILVII